MPKKSAPAEPSPLVQRLASLYQGLTRAYGSYGLLQRKAGGKKLIGKAKTVVGPVELPLWESHLKGEQGLGIVPIRDDATCLFGAIDIDRYDLNLTEVEAQCAKLGLPLLPTRTKSGGIHLYLFGAAPLPAELLKRRLEEWSVALGYGGSEIFPKQDNLFSDKDVGNWINMPYFNALVGKTERYGVFKGKELSLEEFLDRADKIKITEQQLQDLEIAEGEEFLEGPPCLQSLARSGFPEGMRNNGLFAVGVYLKKRYPDDWQAHLLAYNVKFLRPPLGESEVKTLMKTLNRKEYNYTCDKPPIKLFCNRSLCRTRNFGVGKGLDDWGIVIDSDAQKVLTDPPYWIMTVNGQRMQFFAEELMMQRRFQQTCFEKLGFWPPALAPDKWRAEMNKMLQAATEVEAPADAGAGGELEFHLNQYCTVYPQAETKEEILTGKPLIEEGFVLFRAADFKRYLESQHFKALTGTRLFQRMRLLGVTHRQLWIANQNVQVWVIPAPKPPDESAIKGRSGKEGQM